ncbi:hypothetical protein ACS0TY_022747 [Phlomoides rotata]
MATKMLEKFEKYWSQINGIMGVATVLDPRYKFKLLHYYFPLLYSSEDAKKEIERIKEICVDLVNEYSVKFKASGGVGGSFQSLESSFTNPDEELVQVQLLVRNVVLFLMMLIMRRER